MGIKSWAEEDRPREKYLLRGPSHLSVTELLAILIGSGTHDLSAVDLSKEILNTFDNKIQLLSKANVSTLKKFKGIGEAKAVTLCAAFELSRRIEVINPIDKPKIQSSLDAFHCLNGSLKDLNHEEFKTLLLNRQNKLIKIHHVSTGGVTGTVVDPKIIFKEALDQFACGIILCHNHPSGNLKPSQADISLTHKLKQAGKMLDIKVLDHLIISKEGYFSFADEGML